jgi:hypothetical protein
MSNIQTVLIEHKIIYTYECNTIIAIVLSTDKQIQIFISIKNILQAHQTPFQMKVLNSDDSSSISAF